MEQTQVGDRGAARVQAAFRERYGRPSAGCWRAPGRVNLIGEHTDYTGGFVLPLAIAQACYVAAAPASGPTSTVATLWGGADEHASAGDDEQSAGSAPAPVTFDAATLKPGDVPGWAAYVAGTFWALGQKLGTDVKLPAVDLLVDGQVPVGAGLSSSAALECAVAVALTDLLRSADPSGPAAELTRDDLALVAKRCENDFVGAPTGYMDQMASMLGRAGHLLFLDTRSLTHETVPFDPAAQGLSLLVIDTRAPHALVEGEYAARRVTCEQATALLGIEALRDLDLAGLDAALRRLPELVMRRRVRHVVTENARVLEVVQWLRAGEEMRGIGDLLNASHDSLRDDFEVTVPHLDVAVDAARAAGAVGARMTGGGFGGSVIALVDTERSKTVSAAVATAFEAHGFTAPSIFPVSPGPGASAIE